MALGWRVQGAGSEATTVASAMGGPRSDDNGELAFILHSNAYAANTVDPVATPARRRA
jgi:hypothetical protein